MRCILLSLAGCGLEPEERTTPPTLATGPVDEVPPEGTPVVAWYAAGAFAVLPAFVGTADVRGTALAVDRLDGTAAVGFAASGLAPSTPHEAHLHALPCAYDAGGHYLVDPALPAGEENEVWLPVTADADGNGVTWAELSVGLRGDAMSIVVHDPVTAGKLACADLLRAETVGGSATGEVAPFALAEPGDESIGGAAEMVVTPSGTEVTLTLAGLDPAASYDAHVHALPCDVLDGGLHYLLDPLETVTVEENEIWPEITPGSASSTSTTEVPGHQARSDAQAVVIHRDAGAEAPKVACADLARQGYTGLVADGTASPIGATAVTGTAALERRLDGVSVVEVDLAGLSPGETHPVHLHRLPCGVLEGGGHTLLDPTAPEGEGNELWVEVLADAAGTARRAVGAPALVGPDAQSVVVHAPDGTKIACVDLSP